MAWARPRTNGTYTGYYRDPEGKDRSAGTFDKEKDALKAAQDEERKVEKGTWFDHDAGNMAFTDYFETEWIVNRTLTDNGRDTYWSTYRAGLKEKFGALPLSRIKRRMIQTWITDMEKAGVTPRTIKSRVDLLRTVLAAKDGVSAINDGLIPEELNPCTRITLPTVPKRNVQIYTPDQVDKLVAALPEWWRQLVWFDSETGLRWGELIGARVCDVNFLRRRLFVHQSITETKIANTGNGTPFKVKPYPKDKEPRSVGITEPTIEMLARHVDSRGLGEEDFLFSMPKIVVHRTGRRETIEEVDRTEAWPQGRPIARGYFRDIWIKAVDEAGVPMRRRHDLRASFISWLLDDPTVTVLNIMEIVGHSRSETLQRYALGLGHAQESGAAAIDNIRQKYRDGTIG